MNPILAALSKKNEPIKRGKPVLIKIKGEDNTDEYKNIRRDMMNIKGIVTDIRTQKNEQKNEQKNINPPIKTKVLIQEKVEVADTYNIPNILDISEPVIEKPVLKEPVLDIPIIEDRPIEDNIEKTAVNQPVIEESVKPVKQVIKVKRVKIVAPTKMTDELPTALAPIADEESEESVKAAKAKTMKIKSKLPLTTAARSAKQANLIMANSYYLNNRKLYVSKIAKLFQPYKTEFLEKNKQLSENEFELLTHQKIVSSYLNLYTPYRGILLYHGLGSGKSCTSIAIAEGMKSERPVVLMTPASLENSFMNEIKKCGDVWYRRNQFWEFINTQPENINNPTEEEINKQNNLSEILSLPLEYIKKNNGAWLVNTKETRSNYNDLDIDSQNDLNKQLDAMVRSKYKAVHYNGINNKLLNTLTEDGTINPFDNKTVIIDEAHNLVSRIINKIKRKSTTSIAYMLYVYLMRATNTKIVLLSGTPIINSPVELAVLFNILRGYIKQWVFTVRMGQTDNTDAKLSEDYVLQLLEQNGMKTYDDVRLSGEKLYITRNPMGFINVTNTNTRRPGYKVGGAVNPAYEGVRYDETGNISDVDFENKIKSILNTNGFRVVKTEINEFTALPDDADKFRELFIDSENSSIKNEDMFKKRILGLTSYFRSADEKLLPSFVTTIDNETIHIERIPMSDYQFDNYIRVRAKEIIEEQNLRKPKANQKNKNGEDVTSEPSSSYRIFSRAVCNFSFPDPPGRPMPHVNELDAMNENIVDDEDNQYGGDDSESENDESESKKDESTNAKKKTKQNTRKKTSSTDSKAKPKKNTRKNVPALEPIPESVTESVSDPTLVEAAKDIVTIPNEDAYKRAIESALLFVKENNILTGDNLEKYSPKFSKILYNLKDVENRGLHLIYTQFRTLEGVGLLKLILEANGFAEFKISKNHSGVWSIDESPESAGKPKFVLHTGTETVEEKEIILHIYNGTWDLLPAYAKGIADQLKSIASNNNYGEIIKILMITASGREGINLRNTRFVHIVEPFWHMVSIEQAIGRARRINSHIQLPEEDRTVKVFLYLSVLAESQKMNKQQLAETSAGTVIRTDEGLTTDESLWKLSSDKDKINKEALKAIKSTAIDCSVFNTAHNEGLQCFNFGTVTTNSFASYPDMNDDVSKVDVKKVVVSGFTAININNVKYVYQRSNNTIYSFDSYQLAKTKSGQLEKLGTLGYDSNNKPIIVP